MTRAFVDTNVLVYQVDRSEPEKRRLALELFRNWQGTLVLSTQVLQEFYSASTRRLTPALDPDTAEQLCRAYAQLPVVSTDTAMVLAAIELSRSHSLSLWDAMIVCAAQESACSVLFTEDLQHGQRFGSVEVINPFLGDEVHESEPQSAER